MFTALAGCAVVFTGEIGGFSARRLQRGLARVRRGPPDHRAVAASALGSREGRRDSAPGRVVARRPLLMGLLRPARGVGAGWLRGGAR
jgi:hypothetical protein